MIWRRVFGKIRNWWNRVGSFFRLALPGVICLAAFSMSGCLARNAGPSLPYVKPAQSVPATDPMAMRVASRVEEMEGEIQRLRGYMEQLGHTAGNEPVIRNLQDRVAAIERQLGMSPSKRASAVQQPVPQPMPQPAPQPVQPVVPHGQAMARPDAGPFMQPATSARPDPTAAPVEIRNDPVAPDEAIYRSAFNLLRAKSYDEAANQFEELLQTYPQSQLAADATYSIGEARFFQGRFEEAVLQFDKVIKQFPGSKKELDAYLKQGQAFEKMGDPKSAKIIYQQLVSQNPHTPQGREAAGRLKSIPRQ